MKLTPVQSAQLVALAAQKTGKARLTIGGTSMQPLLRAGMVIDVEPLTAPPRAGDILVFRARTGLIAHRFIGGRRAGFITCGDAHPDRAETVPERLVIGRVCAVWTSAAADARRLDDARYRRRGRFIARTRAVRALLLTLRAYGAAVARKRIGR